MGLSKMGHAAKWTRAARASTTKRSEITPVTRLEAAKTAMSAEPLPSANGSLVMAITPQINGLIRPRPKQPFRIAKEAIFHPLLSSELLRKHRRVMAIKSASERKLAKSTAAVGRTSDVIHQRQPNSWMTRRSKENKKRMQAGNQGKTRDSKRNGGEHNT